MLSDLRVHRAAGLGVPAKTTLFAGGNGGGRLALLSEKRPQAVFPIGEA
jgi:hypothetical protein